MRRYLTLCIGAEEDNDGKADPTEQLKIRNLKHMRFVDISKQPTLRTPMSRSRLHQQCLVDRGAEQEYGTRLMEYNTKKGHDQAVGSATTDRLRSTSVSNWWYW